MASIAAMVTPHTALNFGLFVQASSNRILEKISEPSQVNVDYQYGFIRGVAKSTAREHDDHQFDEVLNVSNPCKAIDADKGCDSAQRRERLKALALKDGI